MNTQSHPITPPPELVGEWLCQDGYPWDPDLQATVTITTGRLRNVATQAARWGADKELEACCEWVDYHCSKDLALDLRDARRPKPPSLKQQALEAVDALEGFKGIDTIRRALEQLDD